MILTADSRHAHASRRRRTGNGWHTTFIGENRYTRDPAAAEPDPHALYPMAFLVEKEAGAVVNPHFHQSEQFQVVVAGGGSFGRHPVDGIAVHYTGPYSAYGPIVAADEGIAWFTLRNGWDPGARYMPAERAILKQGRARWAHREAKADLAPVLDPAALGTLGGADCEAILAEPDGMGAWRHRLPPGAAAAGPAPADGGGQFWLVLAGTIAAGDAPALPVRSCVFVSPEDPPLEVRAGPEGAELLCMQFPRRAPH